MKLHRLPAYAAAAAAALQLAGAGASATTTTTTTSTFEAHDFNVSAALEKLGVDISRLPEPEAGFIVREEGARCEYAVSTLAQPCAAREEEKKERDRKRGGNMTSSH